MDRIKRLLAAKQTSCVLKKQAKHLTAFFFARLKEYSLLVNRPAAASVTDRLWEFLWFIGNPNEDWKKEDKITRDWSDLERDLKKFI